MFVGKLSYWNKIFKNISIKLYISLPNFILVIRKKYIYSVQEFALSF